jgi:hypothetical protein
VAADFPNVNDRYLRGLTVSAITGDWLADICCGHGPGDNTCEELFTELTGVVMAREGGLRKQAVAWTRVNLDSDESIVIGGTRIAVQLAPHYLDVTPSG